MPVYSHCPYCGYDFESRGFSIGFGANVTMIGGEETCPNCGKMARVMDGNFTMRGPGEPPIVHSAPPWTKDLINRLTQRQIKELQARVKWAERQLEDEDADEQRTAAALEKAIEDALPEAKSWLDALGGRRSMALAAWIGVLITLITLILQVAGQGGVSDDDVRRIVDETVKSIPSEQYPTEPASPTPPAAPQPPAEEPPVRET